jgi:hypothetical protein
MNKRIYRVKVYSVAGLEEGAKPRVRTLKVVAGSAAEAGGGGVALVWEQVYAEHPEATTDQVYLGAIAEDAQVDLVV